jgi:alkylhydroperoxidase family enzyme
MARLLHEIEWGEPLLATPAEGDFEAELVRKVSPWLASAVLSFNEQQKVAYTPLKLMGVAYLVACQENSCRYCYGMARTLMKIWGYSERQIQDLEHEANLADGSTRGVVEFARKLAHANPTPAKRDREELMEQGLSSEQVAEIAGYVVKACFANRMATFLAVPPNAAFESIPNTLFGKLFAFILRKKFAPKKSPPPSEIRQDGPCAGIIAAAGRTHLGAWLRRITDGWLASPVIPRRSKLLMLAVIARQLGSRACEEEARSNLGREGLKDAQTQTVLSTLSSPDLSALETRLLRWTRETVWYEPRVIQESTRRLMGELGERQTLEAVGTAAICNSLSRLSLVQQ